MPAFANKNSGGMDWGGFAAVSPEAKTWKPDPDSIAKPGSLADARFNRDRNEKKKAASKNDETRSFPAKVSASMKSESSATSQVLRGVNGWPAPKIRASGLPRAVVDESHSPLDSDSSVSSTTSTKPLPSTSPLTESHSPAKLIASMSSKMSTPIVRSVPTTKLLTSIPPHLRKNAQAANRSLTMPLASIPPHLRKKTQAINRGLDPAAKSYVPVKTAKAASPIVEGDMNKNNDTTEDADLALELATKELGVEHPEEGLQLQKKMLEDYLAKSSNPPPPAPPSNHTHWLKMRLIMIMEEDLDLRNRATRSELMAMSDHDIDQFMTKVASAHKHWWEAEKRLSERDDHRTE